MTENKNVVDLFKAMEQKMKREKNRRKHYPESMKQLANEEEEYDKAYQELEKAITDLTEDSVSTVKAAEELVNTMSNIIKGQQNIIHEQKMREIENYHKQQMYEHFISERHDLEDDFIDFLKEVAEEEEPRFEVEKKIANELLEQCWIEPEGMEGTHSIAYNEFSTDWMDHKDLI